MQVTGDIRKFYVSLGFLHWVSKKGNHL